MNINWYMKDRRFEAGTVVDFTLFRLTLSENAKGWALYAAFRKADGSLAQRCKVMQLGKCTLEIAQDKAESWLGG